MGLHQVHRLDDAQVAQLVMLFQQEWWTRGRTLEETRAIVEHSDVVVGFVESGSGRLAAFARVLTDRVIKALIFDVMVAAEHRGAGLGRRLMQAILEHRELRHVRHIELYCKSELIPFYEQFAFTAELGDLRFMRRTATSGEPHVTTRGAGPAFGLG